MRLAQGGRGALPLARAAAAGPPSLLNRRAGAASAAAAASVRRGITWQSGVVSALAAVAAAPVSASSTANFSSSILSARPFTSSSSARRQRGAPAAPAAAASAAAAAADAAAAATAADAAAGVEALRAQLVVHDTMTRQKQPLRPRPGNGERIQMYVCGVTVYDYSHIGHARVYVAFDILYRLLARLLRYDVQYVRNFTDVDDKIIARANEAGEDPLALAGRFITEFHADMASLNCLPPTLEPRATDFIPQMIASIERMIGNGHAYAVDGGDVYFDVASLPGYGRLSRRGADDNRAGERVAVDARKRGPADFALWKAAKPGEPAWPSPWGDGRPGWHIECSSMIEAVMGPLIDVHGGGRDLVFPHHENELAQARATAGCCAAHAAHNGDGAHSHAHGDGNGGGGSGGEGEFARLWMHNGFVNVDSEKMSKSLGNFFTIRDVLKQYHPMAMRWFLASTHYRAPVNYSTRALDEASDRVYYVYSTLLDAAAALDAMGDEGRAAAAQAAADEAEGAGEGAALAQSVRSALLDDLNTPAAIGALSGPLKALNDLLTTKAGRKHPQRALLAARYTRALRGAADLLGLLPPDLGVVLAELRALALTRAGLTEAEVEARIAARAAARAAKDFDAADAVRRELEARGVLIMDAPGGTTWRPGLCGPTE